jgi:hypothetical protein
MIEQRELERAVTRPWSVYEEPEHVLADTRLSAVQKRRILESWERDARELAAAEEENETVGDGEPKRLGRVRDAIDSLPADEQRSARREGTDARSTSSSAAPASGGQRLSGREARQGEIILRTPARKAIFIGGIVLAAVVCVFFFYQATM